MGVVGIDCRVGIFGIFGIVEIVRVVGTVGGIGVGDKQSWQLAVLTVLCLNYWVSCYFAIPLQRKQVLRLLWITSIGHYLSWL